MDNTGFPTMTIIAFIDSGSSVNISSDKIETGNSPINSGVFAILETYQLYNIFLSILPIKSTAGLVNIILPSLLILPVNILIRIISQIDKVPNCWIETPILPYKIEWGYSIKSL